MRRYFEIGSFHRIHLFWPILTLTGPRLGSRTDKACIPSILIKTSHFFGESWNQFSNLVANLLRIIKIGQKGALEVVIHFSDDDPSLERSFFKRWTDAQKLVSWCTSYGAEQFFFAMGASYTNIAVAKQIYSQKLWSDEKEPDLSNLAAIQKILMKIDEMADIFLNLRNIHFWLWT